MRGTIHMAATLQASWTTLPEGPVVMERGLCDERWAAHAAATVQAL